MIFRISNTKKTPLVWKLDRLGRDLKSLVTMVDELGKKSVGFKVLTGQGVQIDTTTPNGRLVFGIFAALAEFERSLIVKGTKSREGTWTSGDGSLKEGGQKLIST